MLFFSKSDRKEYSDLTNKANSSDVPRLNKATANIVNDMTISYVGSAQGSGNDTLQFGWSHGNDAYFLKFGANGIQFVKNGSQVWMK